MFTSFLLCLGTLLSVSLVKTKLDPESLGIILLGPFLLEFFPDQVGVRVSVLMCPLLDMVKTSEAGLGSLRGNETIDSPGV